MSSNPGGTGLEILIKSILDSKGFDDLKTKLTEGASAAKDHAGGTREATDESAKFKDTLGGLGSKLAEAAGEIFAAEKALSFFKDSLKEAISSARMMQQFAAANAAAGQATADLTEKNKKWIESMEVATGVDKDQLVPAYIKLVAATNDVEGSQRLMQIAAGAAARGMGDISENAGLLAKVMIGAPFRATTAFGIELKKLHGEGKTTTQILEIMGGKFGDAGKDVHNAGLDMDRAKERWKNFKEEAGGLGLKLVEYVKPAFQGVATVLAYIVGGTKLAGTQLGIFVNLAGAGFSAFKELLKGHFSEAKRIMKDAGYAVVETWSNATKDAGKTIDGLLESFHRGTEGLLKHEKHALDELVPPIKLTAQELADLYEERAMRARVAQTSEEEGIGKLIVIYSEYAKDVRATSKQQAHAEKEVTELIEKRFELLQKVRDEERRESDLVDENWNRRYKTIFADYQKMVAEKLKLADMEMKTRGQYDLASQVAAIAAYREESRNFKVEIDRRREYAEKAAELEIRLAQNKLSMQMTMAQAGMQLGRAVFGQNKQLAIADALISTYAAVAGALQAKPITWFNAVLAALYLATGLAQVANIQSTEPGTGGGGKGFDDPSNDFASYLGGQKWARDMVDRFSGGAAQGFSNQVVNYDQSRSSSSVVHSGGNRSTTINVQAGGLIDSGNDAFMRRFVRQLQVYIQLEGQATPK